MPVPPTIPCQSVTGTIGKISPGVVGSFEGAWTYCNGIHGPFVKSYSPMPIAPGHFPIYDNNIVALVTSIWRDLTPEQQATWAKPAYRKRLPPYTYFVGVNLTRYLKGLPYLATPTETFLTTVIVAAGDPSPWPDVTGTYEPNGEHDGKPCFILLSADVHLYWDADYSLWFIADSRNPDAAWYAWSSDIDEPNRIYTPWYTATGNLSVSGIRLP